MGPAAGMVSEVVPTAGRMLDGSFVNSTVNVLGTFLTKLDYQRQSQNRRTNSFPGHSMTLIRKKSIGCEWNHQHEYVLWRLFLPLTDNPVAAA